MKQSKNIKDKHLYLLDGIDVYKWRNLIYFNESDDTNLNH